ncbi:MAG: hypothetical protein HY956_10315 [Deltaproteobacteria bacterium]|nr:hypothetical protein [Deltaproteobacteria bacterium]
MKRTFALAALLAFTAVGAYAAEKGVKGMSQEEMIKTAKSAAPAHISENATVMLPGPDGKLQEAVKGTNEFTCIPDISAQEKPDPICGDKAATDWVLSAINKEERPSNTEPGIAYMGQGGWHWEKDGKVVMDPATPGAKRVKEPPHWMIFWPVSSAESMIPERPTKFGAYVMYEGTPYAHLMIYQDPNDLPKKK